MKWLRFLQAFGIWLSVWLQAFPTAIAAEKPTWWQQAETLAHEEGYRLISTADLAKLYTSKKAFRIIDVRTDYEFAQGHLPGAVHLTFDLDDRYRLKPYKRTLFVKALGPDKHMTVILYCRNYT